jgi:hypothetical protein
MILGWHHIERYSSLGQYRTDSHILGIAVRGPVFADDVLAKTGSVVDAQDTTDSPGCSTDSSTYDGADRTRRSIASGRTIFGTPDRSLRIRREWQTHDDEGGNCKAFNLHDCSFLFAPR